MSSMKVILLLIGCLQAAWSAPFPGEVDLVENLPGLDVQLSERHYSGFLNSTNDGRMHYWFFESQSNPSSDPVVLWLNGGPAASSLLGAFGEIGPIRIDALTGSLSQNSWSWNKAANLLFFESPIGVGFSHNPKAIYNPSDNGTRYENLVSLRSFYDKFPHLLNNDFFIVGESYAGVYVPTLSVLLLEQKFPPNFLGVAIGNGLIDGPTNYGKSENQFLRSHGLQPLEPSHPINISWGTFNLNVYNIHQNCKSYFSTSAMLHASMVQPFLSSISETTISNSEIPPCDNLDQLDAYLSQPEVQRAINVESAQVKQFKSFNKDISYPYYQSDLFGDPWESGTIKPYIEKVLESGIRMLIYNGDLDFVCNFIGAPQFVRQLGRPLLKEYLYEVNKNHYGGLTAVYQNLNGPRPNLIFATVKGAGHMVPTDQPETAFSLFSALISNENTTDANAFSELFLDKLAKSKV